MAVEQQSDFSVVGGKYQLEKLLGAGERKRVYLAHDPQLDTEVAVALIPPETPTAGGRSITQWEAQLMARLRGCPQVVTVFEAGMEGGWSYIVSQYMAGGDLGSVCRKARRAGEQLFLDRALEITHATPRMRGLRRVRDAHDRA